MDIRTDIDWYLSKTAHGSEPLDSSPQLVCIRWLEDDVVVRITEYTLTKIDNELTKTKLCDRFREVLNQARFSLINASTNS